MMYKDPTETYFLGKFEQPTTDANIKFILSEVTLEELSQMGGTPVFDEEISLDKKFTQEYILYISEDKEAVSSWLNNKRDEFVAKQTKRYDDISEKYRQDPEFYSSSSMRSYVDGILRDYKKATRSKVIDTTTSQRLTI